MHVYRWDLDKTYLATDFDSVRGLVRAALEPAASKRNVPGSAALLRSLIDSDDTAKVHIISGSPTQMREKLEQKLTLDGVRFDRLVLKDNLRNIRKGRLRAVKDQLGYKLPHLFEQRVGLGVGVQETLFGDDAEVDALVYTLYADAIARRVEEQEVARIMESAGAYPEAIRAAQRALRRTAPCDAVEDIFIHVERGRPIRDFRLLGAKVIPVFSWFQAALVLWKRGRLDGRGLGNVARLCAEEGGLDEHGLSSLVQDLVRRHHLLAADARLSLDASPVLAPLRPLVSSMLDDLGTRSGAPATLDRPAYLTFMRGNPSGT